MPKGKKKGKRSDVPVRQEQILHQEGSCVEMDSGSMSMVQPSTSHGVHIPSSHSESGAAGSKQPSNSDNKVPTSGVEKSSTQMQSKEVVPINLITPGLPPKQTPGRLGRRVKLICNLFEINLLPDGYIYHYDVKIIRLKRSESSDLAQLDVDENVKKYRCLSTKVNRKVIEVMLHDDGNFNNSHIVYDGKYNLYSPHFLDLKFPYESTVVIEDDGPCNTDDEEKDKFCVIINPVKKEDGTCAINFYPLHELFNGKEYNLKEIQEAFMALETIFRHSPALRFTPIGRSFFHPGIGGECPLSLGVNLWFGYHQSIRLAESKPTVNLDTSATTFYAETSLLEYFAKSLDLNVRNLPYMTSLNQNKICNLNKELKNLKIKVNHQLYERKYTIIRVTNDRASDISFPATPNSEVLISIPEYFRQRYDLELHYPHLPCVQVKPEEKHIYFPLEVCKIVGGQHCKKELSLRDKTEMIKYTSDPPKVKFNKIDRIRTNIADYESDDWLNVFDIGVEPNPLTLTGRILEAPSLNYKNKKIQPFSGSWNLKGLKFYKGAVIKSWILLSLTDGHKCSYRKLKEFAETLVQVSNATGMTMNLHPCINILYDERIDVLENKILREFHDIKTKTADNEYQTLVLVVIPGKNKFSQNPQSAKREAEINKRLYKTVKQIAEVECGLITQCIDHNNVLKCNLSLASNICQKINAKLGGTNHTLAKGEVPLLRCMDTEPTIIMGADVSHPSITDRNKISVAALVGSVDLAITRFVVTCKLQKNKYENKKSEEIIQHLKIMVKDILTTFSERTGLKPVRVVFYRDGVSEGQFQTVQKEEISAIRSAWEEMRWGKLTKLTYVVCQKRHHVRFKLEDPRDGDKNVPPGTVVDTEVVHPVHNDFFLNSQCGIKGTNRTCYYTVLEDGNRFSADDLQTLTYYLCNLFVRCTKSISHPVPVRYAHLAAYRMRLLLPQHETENDREILIEYSRAIQIKEAIQKEMFFV